MPANFDRLRAELHDIQRAARFRRLVPRRMEGRYLITPQGDRLLNFGSNDYLGFALEHQDANRSAELPGGLVGSGTGSGASALVCGWTDQHAELARQIASLESAQSAILFPSGFAACSGTVATLPGPTDLILSDQLNHASIIDGCRLSSARKEVYPHCDWRSVDSILAQRRDQFNQVWIVTDAIFSMDGDVAPLVEMADIAEHHGCHLLVDEAHGTGVFGSGGSGVCEQLGLKDKIPIRIGTLSKALGSQGGFVVGPTVVTDYLVNCCRSLIFSTSLSRQAVASARHALTQITQCSQRQAHVRGLARRLRDRLGIAAATDLEMEVPIIPVMVGDDQLALNISSELCQWGFYVPAIRPPTVPVGEARLRVSLSALHRSSDIDELADRLRKQPLPHSNRIAVTD